MVTPSQLSEWQSRADDANVTASTGSGYDSGAVEITAAAIAAALALFGGSLLVVRRRRSLAPA